MPCARRNSNLSAVRPWSSARSEPATASPCAAQDQRQRQHAAAADAAEEIGPVAVPSRGSYKARSRVTSNRTPACAEDKCRDRRRRAGRAHRRRRWPSEVTALALRRITARRVELVFHPQCFLSCAAISPAATRRAPQAFVEVANDPGFDALWFARGGYGANRIAERAMARAERRRRGTRLYLGYSDAGFLLAGLYRRGLSRSSRTGRCVADINREGGEAAVERALAFLADARAETLEPSRRRPNPPRRSTSRILSPPVSARRSQPDLSGPCADAGRGVRAHLPHRPLAVSPHRRAPRSARSPASGWAAAATSRPTIPHFGSDEEEVVEHWCARAGIPYLGRADIGHDIDNKVVPFGAWRG